MILRWRIWRGMCINYLITGENTCCWSLVHRGADGVNWRYLSLKQFIRIRKGRILSWEEDVKHDNLPWKVISDLKAFESPVAKNYNVSGIPMIYLIDPEGKIKEKGLRREEMIEYINTLFE